MRRFSQKTAIIHHSDEHPAPWGSRGILNYREVRESFSKWARTRVSEEYAAKLVGYLDRVIGYNVIATPNDMLEILDKAPSRKYIIVALRNLLNFSEEMGLLDELTVTRMRKLLKVPKGNPDNYIPSDEKVLDAHHKINIPQYKFGYKILAFSGIRITEMVEFLKNYDDNKIECKENFARYPLFSLRHSKRAYYIYLPVSILTDIKRIEIPLKPFKHYLQRRGLPGKYLRKWNYNFLIMHNVPESVADFIQGRSPVSVGSMHYLAKVKQADFWYEKVADALVKVFEE